MKLQKFLAGVLLAVCLPLQSVHACTLWAAAGTAAEGGGTILAKNRDRIPDHQQVLRLTVPEKGYSYFGIYETKGDRMSLKAGVNEKGLAVAGAAASSIPKQERRGMVYTHGLYEKLLSRCGTVEEALKQKALFLGPQFLMLADRTETAEVEIGPGGMTAVKKIKNGTLHHTNHYKMSSMQVLNRFDGASSTARDRRIGQLLDQTPRPYTMQEFMLFSQDRHDGPKNSIFRTGLGPGTERTMAEWIVKIPRQGAPEIYVRMLNPGEAPQVFSGEADSSFFHHGAPSFLLREQS